LIKGKVIRGLNEKSAKRIISMIIIGSGTPGKILMIARRETSDGRRDDHLQASRQKTNRFS